MSNEGERALDKVVREETAKDPQFMDKMEYWNYLWDTHVNNSDCSNKFGWEHENVGKTPTCTNPYNCKHIEAVSDGMKEKFGE